MRRLLAITLGVAAALAAAAPSHAAEPKRPSAGLRAYGLDWLQYVRARDIPATRYAVCIVDNGVAVTPDTPPDDPNGPILKRLSIDGGSGEPQGTAPEFLHGTRMAMAAVAPRNGWGMVGMFPQGRVVSVRASVSGESTFRPGGYARGINLCLKVADELPLAAISLSLGCGDCGTNADVQALEKTVRQARDRGIPVVASAGNSSGAVQFPASLPGTVVIAAGGNRGRLCRNGAFDSTVFALAPACPVVAAEPLSGALEPRSDGGSSVAALQAAVLVSSLRTLRPEVSAAEAIAWISAGRRSSHGRPVLHGEGAARLGKVGPVLTRAVRASRAGQA